MAGQLEILKSPLIGWVVGYLPVPDKSVLGLWKDIIMLEEERGCGVHSSGYVNKLEAPKSLESKILEPL